jgi:hypothetical protein
MGRAIRPGWLAWTLVLAACSSRTDDAPSREAEVPKSESRARQREIHADSTQPDWLIVPGRSGPVTTGTSEADLRQRYGASAIKSTPIELGEGETAPGTVLFADDSLRRLEVVWQDTLQRRRPARLILRGSRSQWQLGRGISLGTSLQELERLNGRPFTLAGFGWDYAGVVTDWKGGALDNALAGVKLYLDPGPAQHEFAAYSQVLGDRDYSSALPPMQQLTPRVTQIYVDFDRLD